MPVGSHITYTTPGKLVGWRVGIFLPEEGVRPDFACSVDGVTFDACSSERSDSAQSTSDYGYYPIVVYRSQELPPGTRFLRVQVIGTPEPGKNAAGLELSWMELDWLD
jgi:hypothetical protein